MPPPGPGGAVVVLPTTGLADRSDGNPKTITLIHRIPASYMSGAPTNPARCLKARHEQSLGRPSMATIEPPDHCGGEFSRDGRCGKPEGSLSSDCSRRRTI